MTDAVLEDHRTAPIDGKLKAMLTFIEKLNRAPAEIGRADMQAVLATGVTRQAVRDALDVAALFETITRLADAFGFAIPDEAAFAASASSLVRFGYRL